MHSTPRRRRFQDIITSVHTESSGPHLQFTSHKTKHRGRNRRTVAQKGPSVLVYYASVFSIITIPGGRQDRSPNPLQRLAPILHLPTHSSSAQRTRNIKNSPRVIEHVTLYIGTFYFTGRFFCKCLLMLHCPGQYDWP